MDMRTAAKEIKEGKNRPIYVVYGKDRYRMQEFVSYLSDQLLDAEHRDLGLVKFDTSESSIDEAVLEAETLPFFVAHKIVLIRDQTLLAAGGKEGGKIEHNTDRLLQYLKEPCDTSTIVFVVPVEKLDERRKLVKQLKSQDALLSFPELAGQELTRWIVRRASGQGRTITEDAAELIVLRAGTALQQLAQEVDKLCLFAGQGGTVGREDVERLLVSSVEEDVFALVDAMTGRQTGRALGIYKDLLLRREEPIKIAALMARQFRIMLQIKGLEEQQYSPQQMASQLGLHPYVVKLSAEKAKGFGQKELADRLSKLADLDFKMKTGQVDKVLGVELFLLSMSA
ncbi:DNA polymerase III subunit delta [Paenibacillaceae bacterium]|nr:DNA polymerase III subunit delta [Paenibacillaceae bacterium]